MTLVDSVEAGKLTISELIDTLAKDKNYESSKWDKRWQPAKNYCMDWHNPTSIKCLTTARNTLVEQARCV